GRSAAQSTGEIRWNYDESIQVEALERLFRILHACISMRHIEIHVLGKRVDETPAFCCDAMIDDTRAQVANLRVQGISEYDQHHCRRKHQLNQENAVAPELLNFLHGQSEITSYEGWHWNLLS